MVLAWAATAAAALVLGVAPGTEAFAAGSGALAGRRRGLVAQGGARGRPLLAAKKRRRYADSDDQDFWYSDRDADQLFDKRMASAPPASSSMDGFEVYSSRFAEPSGSATFPAPAPAAGSVNGQPFDMDDLPDGVSFTPAFVPESIEEWEPFRVDDDFELRKEDVEALWDTIFVPGKRSMDVMDATSSPAGSADDEDPDLDELLAALRENLLLEPGKPGMENIFGLPAAQRIDTQAPTTPEIRAMALGARSRQGSEPEYPFTETWVSAATEQYRDMVRGCFENWGVDLVENFPGDAFRMENVRPESSLEDVALAKAHALAKATGLPAVAMANAADVEAFGSRRNAVNARFRIVDAEASAARFVEQLRLTARPGNGHRMVTFETVAAFVNPGPDSWEVVDYGYCRADVAAAHGSMFAVSTDLALQMLSGKIAMLRPDWYWEPPAWRTPTSQEETAGQDLGAQRLQERLLKDGRVLESSIVDVSSFMDGYVDVSLVQDCGAALARRFSDARPTKILTVATTGLAAAVPVAQALQVPMVYARKQRSVVMPDSYIASYSSRTVGKSRQLLIVKEHIDPGDRVLIVDDFLSSGGCQDALLRILGEAGAECIGVGVLFEKVYEAGRNYLSGYGLRIESLARIQRVDRGTIELVEGSAALEVDADDYDGEPPPSLLRGPIAGRL